MLREYAGCALLAVTLLACGGSNDPSTGSSGSTSSTGSTDSTGTASGGHGLVMDVKLVAENGELAFLSPSNTIIKYPTSQIVGKPYLIAAFAAGFSPGNDPPLDYVWGKIGADLAVHYQTPATLQDGPYDMVFVGYTFTTITPEIMAQDPQSAPAAKGGDIASFSLDGSPVKPGDPKNALGTIRFNVEGADASVELENRTPKDPNDAQQTSAAFNNTILTIP